MLAQIGITATILCYINNPVFAWRIFIGPVNVTVATLVNHLREFFGQYMLYCSCDIIIVRLIQLYRWNFFCTLNEVFLFRTLVAINW